MKLPVLKKNFQPGWAILLMLTFFINPDDDRDQNQDLGTMATRDIIPTVTEDSQLLIYKKVSDSLEKIIQWQKHRVTNAGENLLLGFAGVTHINECDSCMNADEKTSNRKYFVSFKGFVLKQDTRFFIEGNNYKIEKFIPEKTAGNVIRGRTEQKKVNFRLSKPDPGEKGLTLMVPVKHDLFNGVKIVMYIILGICLILGTWLFIILPVRVLVNITNGKPFLEKNFKFLNQTGWGIIGACLILILVPKLFQWMLPLPEEIYYPIWSSVVDYRWLIFLGIVVLMIANAFREGYKLQQEQDLT